MLPNIGTFHPQIVHFVIGLLYVGVALRLVSLTGKLKFTGPAAATLILLGTGAAVLAVKSGTDAHGPVERIPGARAAVQEHEEWGERTRNIFLLVGVVELAAIGLRQTKYHRGLLAASAVIGLGGLLSLFEAGEHGGHLVYEFAGGVGTRSGNPQDIPRLLLAGLYQNAMAARSAGDREKAASLIEQMAQRFPESQDVTLLHIESMIVDRKDGAAALAAIQGLHVPADNGLLQLRVGYLKSDAYLATGRPDSARATLEMLSQAFPNNPRIKDRLARIKG